MSITKSDLFTKYSNWVGAFGILLVRFFPTFVKKELNSCAIFMVAHLQQNSYQNFFHVLFVSELYACQNYMNVRNICC